MELLNKLVSDKDKKLGFSLDLLASYISLRINIASSICIYELISIRCK